MDGFFRETKEKVAYRKSEGCSVVEMECSALAACAAFRSATWGMLLYTADSLADVQRYDQRHWGGSAYEYAPDENGIKYGEIPLTRNFPTQQMQRRLSHEPHR